ncbi:lactate utilization protein [Desulforhopalus sp. IMCC35007]|uniref:lactate utilization protein n=1 Tax=Desulforhopalus sp. IMCC35007 TaxID=2569543 RepID=UPI0010ADCF86|nr:lactate utilization protein [Desulforhopalus sp. IMCC35007]TKB07574.1 lactate utilization protein [Desulforhopalus sp. IMCC35007]
MDNPSENFWKLRLEQMKAQLNSNNFEAFVVKDKAEAAQLIIHEIFPACKAKSVSYGGSMTLKATGVLEAIAAVDGVEMIIPDDPKLSMEEKLERRRQGLLVDFYLTGTNALTEDGHLVNLDMIGNRVAALTFGPKKVVVLIGRNKIVPDLESAMYRIKDYAAPTNAMRLDCKTPCAKTSECADCKSPGRICNSWAITEKSFPKNRITVILIDEELGL